MKTIKKTVNKSAGTDAVMGAGISAGRFIITLKSKRGEEE